MDRDVAKMCKLEHQQQYQQQIIINGIPQGGGDPIPVPFLVCPNCGNIVAQFNAGTHDIAVYQACEKELAQQIKYCVKCGQKLSYPTVITIDPKDFTVVEDN